MKRVFVVPDGTYFFPVVMTTNREESMVMLCKDDVDSTVEHRAFKKVTQPKAYRLGGMEGYVVPNEIVLDHKILIESCTPAGGYANQVPTTPVKPKPQIETVKQVDVVHATKQIDPLFDVQKQQIDSQPIDETRQQGQYLRTKVDGAERVKGNSVKKKERDKFARATDAAIKNADLHPTAAEAAEQEYKKPKTNNHMSLRQEFVKVFEPFVEQQVTSVLTTEDLLAVQRECLTHIFTKAALDILLGPK